MSATISEEDRKAAARIDLCCCGAVETCEQSMETIAQAIADARERERADCYCKTRQFRVMDAPTGCPQLVPWWLLAPFEPQALKNHSQTLERLNDRGGLCPAEMLAVIEGRHWHHMDDAEAGRQLAKIVADAIAARGSK